jgi:hypothetical protein
MNKLKLIGLAMLFLLGIVSGCKKDKKEVDTTYPTISIEAANAFPKQCSVIKRGEKFTFRAELSDNVALGSVSIDIHHNFDQHSHSTEVLGCNMEAKKTPINPLLYIKDFPIPSGQKSYQMVQEIEVPATVDPGDYHFLIRLTDQSGWQTIKGLSIKIQ